MTSRPVPRATYRLQLHKDFRFADAGALAPYLAALGISHAYLSPVLKARPGSTHGYDTVDHTVLNPELGSRADFDAMAAAFRVAGIGLVLDIVPNHMGIGGSANPYWLDVLEWGEQSRFAGWFDIDWHPPLAALSGKVLVPFLGVPYETALLDGTLKLKFDRMDASFAVWAHEAHKLPIAPQTYMAILGDRPEFAPVAAADPCDVKDALRELVDASDEYCLFIADRLATLNGIDGAAASKQHLARLIDAQHWLPGDGATDRDLNYRRFFIVDDLAGIRIERQDVFDHVHALIFELIEAGLVDGLRVDHIDGLRDPRHYLRCLRAAAPRPIYLVVEKILGEGERLPPDWQVDGTTGYEFAAGLLPTLVDPAAEPAFTELWEQIEPTASAFDMQERHGKLELMATDLAPERDALVRRLVALADRQGRHLDQSRLRGALRALVAELPVYRTYVDEDGARPQDAAIISGAAVAALNRDPSLDRRAMAFVAAVLGGTVDAEMRADALDIALRAQQFTGPVMAKGLEDTALYRDNRLVALNDVGERPSPFRLPVKQFHAANAARLADMPHSLLATSTHDSKRGEDTRYRLAALTDEPAAWAEAVPGWLGQLCTGDGAAVHPADAYLCLQLMVGAWPSSLRRPLDGASLADFAGRLKAAMQKSLREARLRSAWRAPDVAYEAAMDSLIDRALSGNPENDFLSAFLDFIERLGPRAARRSLGATLLKLTVPGVPDIYQGAELWEQSLVDPDNRRPVDFDARRRLLAEEGEASLRHLLSQWPDGAVKQQLIARVLAFRTTHAELFATGSYEPLDAGEAVCAFLRRQNDAVLLVAVRLWGSAPAPATLPLPPDLGPVAWRDLLGGGDVTGTQPMVPGADWPVLAWSGSPKAY